MTTSSTPFQDGQPRDDAYWAQPVSKLAECSYTDDILQSDISGTLGRQTAEVISIIELED